MPILRQKGIPTRDVAPYPQDKIQSDKVNAKLAEWDSIQNSPGGWWKGKSIPTTKDPQLRRQLASNQVGYDEKPTSDKAKDFAINAGLSLLPEIAMGAKSLPIVRRVVKGLSKTNPLESMGSKQLLKQISKDAERPLSFYEDAILKQELAEKGILDVQKTRDGFIKNAVHGVTDPWDYSLNNSMVGNSRLEDLWSYISNKKLPQYAYNPVTDLDEAIPGTYRKFRDVVDSRQVDNRNLALNKFGSHRGVSPDEEMNLIKNNRANRYTTWDMYLGKSQTKHPMYDISPLSTNKELVYTIKPDYLVNRPNLTNTLSDIYARRSTKTPGLMGSDRDIDLSPYLVDRTESASLTKGFDKRYSDTDTYFGTAGGMGWDTKELPSGNMEAVMTDVWDLHPFKSQNIPLPKKLTRPVKLPGKGSEPIWPLNKLQNIAKNIEVGSALGIGKPLNVKVGFEYNPRTNRVVRQYKVGGLLKQK
jgi:hypothetical protein